MSVEALNAVRRHRFGSMTRKMLAYVLADYAAADWSTYVGQKRLAAETELGERTVRRLIADLEAVGLIRRERRYGAKRGRTTDRIVLVRSAIDELPASVAASTRDRTLGRGRPIYRPTTTDLPANDDRSTGHSLAGQLTHVNLIEPGVIDELPASAAGRTGSRTREARDAETTGGMERVGDVLQRVAAAARR